jgi:(E)-4-hydroxy-3-methylbut-2-enyl-diphosphate synthase
MEPHVFSQIIKINGYNRRITQPVNVGGLALGDQNPIRLQSMTTTNTNDIEATVEQAIRIINAGGHYVRITAQGVREAESLGEIRKLLQHKGFNIPLIADIHFNPQAALAAATKVSKIRINPGNYADPRANFSEKLFTNQEYEAELVRVEERFVPLIETCKQNAVAMRIGVNHGSLSDRIMNRYGDTPMGMALSAMEFLRICKKHSYLSVVVSMKSSSTRVMVQATRLLVKLMDDEGMNFPVHLGVTEAGEGEDGRIKSAVGIGTLLVDGIGDTIRVSLTEEPEFEIPVANQLVDIFSQSNATPVARSIEVPINPFTYNRRKTIPVLEVGQSAAPVVIANLMTESEITSKAIENVGWRYSESKNQWGKLDLGADFILVGNAPLNHIKNPETLPIIGNSAFCKYGMANLTSLYTSNQTEPVFTLLKPEEIDEKALNFFAKSNNCILLLSIEKLEGVFNARRAIFQMMNAGITLPVVITLSLSAANVEEFQLNSAALTGTFFIDGLCDGIMLSGNNINSATATSTGFAILQAAGVRVTKTEFISCPGCGRTLFNLNDTLRKVKEQTAHLKGLKIGVMGCIVNGPGEMADAHYGYVGAGAGKITLYKGKEVVKKHIPESSAVDELIAIIKANGDWIDRDVN